MHDFNGMLERATDEYLQRLKCCQTTASMDCMKEPQDVGGQEGLFLDIVLRRNPIHSHRNPPFRFANGTLDHQFKLEGEKDRARRPLARALSGHEQVRYTIQVMRPHQHQRSVRPNRGAFPTEQDALDAVVSRLVEQLKPAAIWLFGSRATGRHWPDSDFDLLVVMRNEQGDAGRDYDRVYAPIVGLGVGVDVVPCTEEDFDQQRLARTGLIPEIVRTGHQIYRAGLVASSRQDMTDDREN
ncbi:putative nucleotidyltransferase [Devosia sp. UYZn731]|uniref:nucleotidyltransferase domain-containing protein n=1 Tax=Devosia sp. UYZn731 TaxID=3156345 RepID=UPI003397C84E